MRLDQIPANLRKIPNALMLAMAGKLAWQRVRKIRQYDKSLRARLREATSVGQVQSILEIAKAKASVDTRRKLYKTALTMTVAEENQIVDYKV